MDVKPQGIALRKIDVVSIFLPQVFRTHSVGFTVFWRSCQRLKALAHVFAQVCNLESARYLGLLNPYCELKAQTNAAPGAIQAA